MLVGWTIIWNKHTWDVRCCITCWQVSFLQFTLHPHLCRSVIFYSCSLFVADSTVPVNPESHQVCNMQSHFLQHDMFRNKLNTCSLSLATLSQVNGNSGELKDHKITWQIDKCRCLIIAVLFRVNTQKSAVVEACCCTWDEGIWPWRSYFLKIINRQNIPFTHCTTFFFSFFLSWCLYKTEMCAYTVFDMWISWI